MRWNVAWRLFESPAWLIAMLLALLAVAGCSQATEERPPGTQVAAATKIRATVVETPTFRPSPTPSPSSTPLPTFTPSPTPTPTPTALPLSLSGDPRAASLSAPTPQGNAPCGQVDVFDFPLDPPDAEAVTFAGQDFGLFRDRYDKFHTGEDWWLSRGRSNFGLPVYSIGHGLVTYAEPEGWGRDKGVIVIRHFFEDGSTINSFYGHLDPPSVVLNAGDCVVRGEQIGNIGRPRSSPHLHFEIRSHLAYAPGPGYWSEDPTLAGWQSPSETIWNKRLAASPGVLWQRPAGANRGKSIGLVDDEVVVMLEGSQLVGVNLSDGSTAWQHSGAEEIDNALIDAGEQLIYTASRRGLIEAFHLPGPTQNSGSTQNLGHLWTVDLDLVGGSTLMPLPDGGLAVSVWQQMVGLSPTGEVLWEHEFESRPSDWLLAGDKLLFMTPGDGRPLWSLDESGPVAWNERLSGRLVFDGDQILLYEDEGLFRLDVETFTSERLVRLSESFLDLGAVIVLPGKGLLLTHRDLADQRLIALDSNGIITWERSFDGLLEGDSNLLRVGDRPYLVSLSDEGSSTELSLFLIDMDQVQLRHLFTGGARSGLFYETTVLTTGDGLILMNIGGNLVAFDPIAAGEIVDAE